MRIKGCEDEILTKAFGCARKKGKGKQRSAAAAVGFERCIPSPTALSKFDHIRSTFFVFFFLSASDIEPTTLHLLWYMLPASLLLRILGTPKFSVRHFFEEKKRKYIYIYTYTFISRIGLVFFLIVPVLSMRLCELDVCVPILISQ